MLNKKENKRVSSIEDRISEVEKIDTRFTRALTNEMDAMLSEAAAKSLKEKQTILNDTIKAIMIASGVGEHLNKRFNELISKSFYDGRMYGQDYARHDDYAQPKFNDLFI